nr:hypothetical protein CFP56_03964 [Quercus suber]
MWALSAACPGRSHRAVQGAYLTPTLNFKNGRSSDDATHVTHEPLIQPKVFYLTLPYFSLRCERKLWGRRAQMIMADGRLWWPSSLSRNFGRSLRVSALGDGTAGGLGVRFTFALDGPSLQSDRSTTSHCTAAGPIGVSTSAAQCLALACQISLTSRSRSRVPTGRRLRLWISRYLGGGSVEGASGIEFASRKIRLPDAADYWR